MKKQLYLHIGRPKVGSTALQNFLRDNREPLLRQGVLYPRSPMFNGASHKLALVFQPELPDAKAVAGQGAEEVYATLLDEIRQSEAQCTVASSENLFLLDPKLPGRFLKRQAEVRIVCYIRRQDEVLVSSLLQELRMGNISADVDVETYATDPERLHWLDYSRILDSWASVFGRDNIIVRVMEAGQLKGTIEEDFISIVGASMQGLQRPAGRSNPSPARDVLQIMQIINKTPEGARPRTQQLLHRSLLQASENLGSHGRFDATALVPPQIRRQLLERFRESNARVARKYLGHRDGVLFRSDIIPEPTPNNAYTGLDLERFATMTMTLLVDQQRQILRLQAQLNALKQQSR